MDSLPPILPLLLLSSSCQATTPEEVASRPAASEVRDVAILLYEGVELLDFAGPGEVFSAARGPAGRAFRLFTVAKSTSPVRSQGFVSITPQHSIADCPAPDIVPDIVVVPGGNVPAEDAELQAWVKRCAASGELVMSVCNGAMLLAEAGLLDGLEATTHHGSLESLASGFPSVRVHTNRRFVDGHPEPHPLRGRARGLRPAPLPARLRRRPAHAARALARVGQGGRPSGRHGRARRAGRAARRAGDRARARIALKACAGSRPPSWASSPSSRPRRRARPTRAARRRRRVR